MNNIKKIYIYIVNNLLVIKMSRKKKYLNNSDFGFVRDNRKSLS